ncbi:uncharacterized protein BXZ73DRAFT_100977 [Epithele typhae]|uniref:uncharacterized protein n=1 Tax=Epithele typhae TaxID=378194 RepID=UPI002008CFFA|nr:uncharacterized protein BXZ73DRAFT_100977 [Epithele typhae]KAH9933595.1 hypothetical protein BXZ73DRAFT_100977 [Epithele typhae]
MPVAVNASADGDAGTNSDGVSGLDDTFGAILICTFLGFMLFGLTVHQSYQYFSMYWTDSRRLKVMVALLVYYYLITSFFQPDKLEYGTWSMRLTPVSAALVILIAQGFYLERVYRIGNPYRYFVYVIGVSMMGFAVVSTIEAWKEETFEQWESCAWMTSVAFAFAVATDVMLTGSLIVFLNRSRTGFRRTDSLLNILIVYTINTGLLTSALSVMCVIFAVAMPYNMIYTAVSIPTTKTYANSVLAVLNSRRSLKDSTLGTSHDFGSFGMSAAVDFAHASGAESMRGSVSIGQTVTKVRESTQRDLELLAQ